MDPNDVLAAATAEIKRIGSDTQKWATRLTAVENAVKSVEAIDGMHERLDAIETAFKRGGINPGAKVETTEQREYKTAFDNWARTGEAANLKTLQRKALSVGSDPDGGYLVPTELSDSVVRKIFEVSPLRRLANVQTVSGTEVDMLLDTDEAGAAWVDEVSPRAATKTPQLGKKRIVVHEMSASPLVTQKLLEDSAIDLNTWLLDKLATKFARAEGEAFTKGTGSGMPRGFLTYPDGEQGEAIRRVKSGAPAGFPTGSGTADALLKMVYALKAAYRTNASFLMPRSVQLAVRMLKDDRGNYLWQPGIAQGQPDRLLGYPVYDAEDMPDMVTGSLSIAFGDWNAAYQIIDRLGLTILRDPYSNKPLVEFEACKRVGGDVINPEALVLLQTGT